MKAIGYVRVSTAGQVEEGVSLEAQKKKIEAWAVVNDYELIGIQVDAGLSGKRYDNRDGLIEALDIACKEKAALIVYSLSRVSRSTKDTISIAERLDKAGADLVSLSERIDTTSASGKMVFRMLAVLNEFERDLVSERTKAALAHLKGQGKRISGKIPYGFDLATDGKALVENKAEQEVITLINQLRVSGYTIQKIVDELENRGISSKNKKAWTPKVVWTILKRKVA